MLKMRELKGVPRASQHQLVSRGHWPPIQIRVGVPDGGSLHDNYIAFTGIDGSFSSKKS